MLCNKNMKNLLEEKLGLEKNLIIENDFAIQLATSWHKIFCPNFMKWIKEKPRNGFRWESVICDNSGNEAIDQYEKGAQIRNIGLNKFINIKTNSKTLCIKITNTPKF